jgi:hypothetical protein
LRSSAFLIRRSVPSSGKVLPRVHVRLVPPHQQRHLVETLDGEACIGSAGVPIAVLGKAQAGIEKAHPSEGLAAVEPSANIVGKADIRQMTALSRLRLRR